MAKEMKQEEKKLSVLIRLGEDILADASLSEDDNAKLQQDLNTLKNRWEALEEKINWRVKRYVVNYIFERKVLPVVLSLCLVGTRLYFLNMMLISSLFALFYFCVQGSTKLSQGWGPNKRTN